MINRNKFLPFYPDAKYLGYNPRSAKINGMISQTTSVESRNWYYIKVLLTFNISPLLMQLRLVLNNAQGLVLFKTNIAFLATQGRVFKKIKCITDYIVILECFGSSISKTFLKNWTISMGIE